MKRRDIKIGETYIAKVSGKLVPVRIKGESPYGGWDAINTTTGALLARIRVGAGPHGLCIYPQPGRYSLGHTGILR